MFNSIGDILYNEVDWCKLVKYQEERVQMLNLSKKNIEEMLNNEEEMLDNEEENIVSICDDCISIDDYDDEDIINGDENDDDDYNKSIMDKNADESVINNGIETNHDENVQNNELIKIVDGVEEKTININQVSDSSLTIWKWSDNSCVYCCVMLICGLVASDLDFEINESKLAIDLPPNVVLVENLNHEMLNLIEYLENNNKSQDHLTNIRDSFRYYILTIDDNLLWNNPKTPFDKVIKAGFSSKPELICDAIEIMEKDIKLDYCKILTTILSNHLQEMIKYGKFEWELKLIIIYKRSNSHFYFCIKLNSAWWVCDPLNNSTQLISSFKDVIIYLKKNKKIDQKKSQVLHNLTLIFKKI